MSQRFSAPIELSVQVPQANWTVARGVPIGLWNSASGSRVSINLISPQKFCGFRFDVAYADVPPELRAMLPAASIRKLDTIQSYEAMIRRSAADDRTALPEPAASFLLDVLLCESGVAMKRFEAGEAREDFFRIGNDLGALRRFLAKYGVWARSGSVVNGPTNITAFLPQEILSSRATFREKLASGREAWFLAHPAHLWLKLRPEFPHFVATVKTAYDAIRASITIELLSGTRMAICARVDCGNPFLLKTQHRRQYCSHECGHLVAVRRGRAATKPQPPQSTDQKPKHSNRTITK